VAAPKNFFSVLNELARQVGKREMPVEQWQKYLSPGRVLKREGIDFPLKSDEVRYGPFSRINETLKELTGDSPEDVLKLPISGDSLAELTQDQPLTFHELSLAGGTEGSFPKYSEYTLERSPVGKYPKSSRDLYPYNEQLTRYLQPGTPPGSTYRSPHFNNNYRDSLLSHSRHTEIPTVSGDPAWLIEELQSDWHNKGHRSGYRESLTPPEIYVSPDPSRYSKLSEAVSGLLHSPLFLEDKPIPPVPSPVSVDDLDWLQREALRHRASDTAQERWHRGAPDAPFKDSGWLGLELRKALSLAAAGDKRALLWTTPEMQAERWHPKFLGIYQNIYGKSLPGALNKLRRQYGLEGDLGEFQVKNSNLPKNMIDQLNDLAGELLYHRDPQRAYEAGQHIIERAPELSPFVEQARDINSRLLSSVNQYRELRRQNPGLSTAEMEAISAQREALHAELEQLQYELPHQIEKYLTPEPHELPGLTLTPSDVEKINRVGLPLYATGGRVSPGPDQVESAPLDDVLRYFRLPIPAALAATLGDISDEPIDLPAVPDRHPRAINFTPSEDLMTELPEPDQTDESEPVGDGSTGTPVIAPAPVAVTPGPASSRQAAPLGATPDAPATPSEAVAYLRALARKESGGDPLADAPTSSALGLYQFTDRTWRDLAEAHPELDLTPEGRTDPAQQERAIRALTDENVDVLSSRGVEPTDANLYLAHFMGPSTAARFVIALDSDPTAPATRYVSPAAARSNRSIFYSDTGKPRSVSQVYSRLTKGFEGRSYVAQQNGPSAT
jgi:hypothetical protein